VVEASLFRKCHEAAVFQLASQMIEKESCCHVHLKYLPLSAQHAGGSVMNDTQVNKQPQPKTLAGPRKSSDEVVTMLLRVVVVLR
jgi:hypothetical protein